MIYALTTILCLLLVTTVWTRKQVKHKTVELAEKNRLLEGELLERQTVEMELRERQQQYQVILKYNYSKPYANTILDIAARLRDG